MFVVDLGIRCFSMLWGGLCLYDMASPCCSTYHGSRICRAALPGAFNWRYSPPFSGKNLFGVNVRQLIEKSFVMYLLKKHKFSKLFMLFNVLYPLCLAPLDALRHGRAQGGYRLRMFVERLRNWH